MEKMRLLINVLLITAFSSITVALSSCDPEDNPKYREGNKFLIVNTTPHLLDIRFDGHALEETFGCRVEPNGTYEWEMGLTPINESFDNVFGAGEYAIKIFQVYIDGKLRKNFVGPAQNLPDSIHSVYNINSWKFGKYLSNYGNTKGDSLETLTFTFTDEDFADDTSGKNETE